jgi:hypothetical protein
MLVKSFIDVKHLIDFRNEDLWNEILPNYKVEIVASGNFEHGVFTQSDLIRFHIPIKDYSKEGFMHELLHAHLYHKNIYIGTSLNRRIKSSPYIKRLFSEDLVSHVGNCLDHIKMLPIYLERGFKIEGFISDYDVNKCTFNDIDLIKKLYVLGTVHRLVAIDYYIGKYFAIKADPNIREDYPDKMQALNDIDSELFSILETFTNEWIQYDIDAQEDVYNYWDIVDRFCDNLNRWVIVKDFGNN